MKWEKKYLKDLIIIKNGKDHKNLKQGIYPVYGSGGILRYVDSYLYDKTSVLLPRKGTLNNIQYVKKPFWTVDTCYYTEVLEDKIDPFFLFCKLKQFDVESMDTGSAIPSMTSSKYYSIQIDVPPLQTQQRIASILSAYDDLIENNQKQIKLLEEAAQRLYKEWFVDLRFPNHEKTKIVDGVPEGWRKEYLINLAQIQYGYAFDGSKFNSKKEGIPIIRIRDIPYGTTSDFTTEVADKQYLVQNGEIVVGMDGEFHINSWSGDTSYLVQRTCCVRPHNNKIKGWLLVAIYDPIKYFEKTVVGATVAHLGKKHIDTIKLLVPPEKYFGYFQVFFEKRQSLLNQNIKLTEARDRLLPKLMNGEIKV